MSSEWLPESMWQQLLPYLDEHRKAEPTMGFMLNCASRYQGFDEDAWRKLSDTGRETKLKQVLGVPKWKREKPDETGVKDR